MVKRPAWLPACPPPNDQPASLGERCKEPEARPIAFSSVMLLLACLSVSAHLLSHTCAALEEKVLSVFLLSLLILSYALRHGTEAMRLKCSRDRLHSFFFFFFAQDRAERAPFLPSARVVAEVFSLFRQGKKEGLCSIFGPQRALQDLNVQSHKETKVQEMKEKQRGKMQGKGFF